MYTKMREKGWRKVKWIGGLKSNVTNARVGREVKRKYHLGWGVCLVYESEKEPQ